MTNGGWLHLPGNPRSARLPSWCNHPIVSFSAAAVIVATCNLCLVFDVDVVSVLASAVSSACLAESAILNPFRKLFRVDL